MVIVVEDTEEPKRQREPGRSRPGAMIVAISALAIVGGTWFWLTRQPPPKAGYGAPHGVIVAGIGTFIAALIVQIRSMSALEMLEALWDALAWLIALVLGATVFALKAVWSWFLALIGWD